MVEMSVVRDFETIDSLSWLSSRLIRVVILFN